MQSFRKISNILLIVVFSLLISFHAVLYLLNMVAANYADLLEQISIIMGLSSLPFVIYEIVCLIVLKKHKQLSGINIALFALYCILSLGLFFKGLFFVLSVILPSSFTLVVTRFGDLFYQGIKYTLGISLIGTVIGFIIACFLGTIRTLKIHSTDSLFVKIVKKLSNILIKIYVTVFRGTPMMVQAMIIFYGFVKLFHWTPVVAGLVIVSINTGAYLTEVVKDGIDSIDDGQMEAARSLGFSYPKALLLIIFPQAIKNSMAAIGNEFVINIKDTSVLNVIGCAEMYYILNMSAGTNYKFMEQMIVGALIYLLLTYTTTKVLGLIEKKLDVPTKELRGSN